MMPAAPSLIKKIESLSDLACRTTEIILCVIGSGMALLIAIQVFSRYLLNYSLFWSEEVGRACLVWITFLGASAAYKRRGHVGMQFLVDRLPISLQRSIQVIVLLLSFIFFAVLVCYGLIYLRFLGGQRTAALGMPVSLLFLVIPASGVLFFLHGLSHLLDFVQSDGK